MNVHMNTLKIAPSSGQERVLSAANPEASNGLGSKYKINIKASLKATLSYLLSATSALIRVRSDRKDTCMKKTGVASHDPWSFISNITCSGGFNTL